MKKPNKVDIPFLEWLKSKFILPSIPFAAIGLIVGVLNFLGYEVNTMLPKIGNTTITLSQFFSFLNLVFSLIVIFLSVNKFKISNENEKNIENEIEYFKYLSLKKGVLFSKTNSKKDWSSYKKLLIKQ